MIPRVNHYGIHQSSSLVDIALRGAIVPFLAVMLFFPSITFSLLSAEIFPWAIMYSLLLVRKVSIPLLLLFGIFLASAANVVLAEGAEFFPEILRSLAAYLNSLLIFGVVLTLLPKDINLLIRIAKYVAIGMAVLGTAQFLGLVSFLSPLFDFLIPRGSANVLGGGEVGARGVSLLSSEPSRAAYELLFIYLIYRFTLLKPTYRLWGDFVVSVLVFFFIRSAVGAVLLLGFWFIFNRNKLVLMSMFIVVCVSLVDVDLSGRAVVVFSTLINMDSLGDAYSYVLNSSGFRLVSIAGGVLYGIINPFGAGVGFWRESSLDALALTSVSPETISYFLFNSDGYWSSVRPASYFGSLMLDLGIIGTAAVIWIILILIKKYKAVAGNKSDLRNIVLFFFLYFFSTGAVGNPIPWLSVAVLIKYFSFKQA